MLLHFKIGVDKNKADKEKVDGQCNGRVLLDGMPGGFHFFAPVDIVENHNGSRVGVMQ